MLREILEYEVKEDNNLMPIGLPKILAVDDPEDFEIQLKTEIRVMNSIGYMTGEILYVGGSKFIPVQYYTLREKNTKKIVIVGVEFEKYGKDGNDIPAKELWDSIPVEVDKNIKDGELRETVGKHIFHEVDFGNKILSGHFEIEEEIN